MSDSPGEMPSGAPAEDQTARDQGDDVPVEPLARPPETAGEPVPEPPAEPTAPTPEPVAPPVAGGQPETPTPEPVPEPLAEAPGVPPSEPVEPRGDGEAPPDTPSTASAGAPPRLPRWLLLALPAVVIGIVIAAFALKSDTDKAVKKLTPATEFVTYTDKVGGFSIKHPKSWKEAAAPKEDLRLLISNGVLDSLLIRVERTASPVPPDLTAEEAKAIADTLIKRPELPPERIVREQALPVNGAPAYYYLYTFEEDVTTDKGTGKVQGVHAHYFVFKGRRAFSLVFQALPSANFQKLAKTFDTMAESFTINPLASDAPEPTSPATTGAPASTPPPSG